MVKENETAKNGLFVELPFINEVATNTSMYYQIMYIDNNGHIRCIEGDTRSQSIDMLKNIIEQLKFKEKEQYTQELIRLD